MNEGELMDEESTESRRIQKSNKILSKGACLFKPKAVLEKINSNTARKSDLNDRRGCDLSYGKNIKVIFHKKTLHMNCFR